MTFQDHFAALNYIRDRIKPAPRLRPEALDWSNDCKGKRNEARWLKQR
jgi:hypothetical protein